MIVNLSLLSLIIWREKELIYLIQLKRGADSPLFGEVRDGKEKDG